MGLAASQARLLTITSRLSSVELRQQRIANDKMRLASDQEEVSNKYTNALSNKTLSFSDGVNTVAMTYDVLTANGYSVKRISDGVIAGSSSNPAKTTIPAKSTQNTNNNSSNSNNDSGSSTTQNPEIQKWVGKPAPTPPESFNQTPPTPPTEKLTKPSAPVISNTTITVPDFNKTISNAQQLANTSYRYTHSWDGSNWEQTQSVFSKQVLDESLSELINNLYNQQLLETGNKLKEAKEKAQQTYDRAPKNLDFNNGDYGQSTFSGRKIKTAENEYASSILSALKSAQSSVNSEVESINQKNSTAQNNYNTELAKYNKNQQEWSNYEKEQSAYDDAYATYRVKYDAYVRDYTNWETANSNRTSGSPDSTVEQTSRPQNSSTDNSTGSTNTTVTPASQELANQLKNSQFLIQGLISGYLALVDKNGQEISLSSATNILEDYDKTDDAAAEAEYNSQMAKLNRKEKMLDMQSKRIDTEYSALTTEYESVKNLISTHAEKDFQYMS